MIEVPSERFNVWPEGLIVLLVRPHINSLEGLRYPRLIKLTLEGLSVSFERIMHRNHAQETRLKSSIRDLVISLSESLIEVSHERSNASRGRFIVSPFNMIPLKKNLKPNKLSTSHISLGNP